MKGVYIYITLLAALATGKSDTLFAQARIKGLVTDSARKPLPQANVLLLKTADSSLVRGTITNEKGLYTLEKIDEGSYFLTYSYTGFQQLYGQPFTVSKSSTEQMVNTISLYREKGGGR